MATLSQYLQDSNLSQREFAQRVGLSKTYISEIVSGAKTPSLRAALAIQKATRNKVKLSSLIKNTSPASRVEAAE